MLVPVVPDPVERFNGVHERLSQAKTERAIRAMDAIAGAVNTLPTSLLVRFARSQVETVDFATSNVRAALLDLYISGAKILANYPMGPTGGTALNATMMSYGGSLDIGLNLDAAAVEDAELLRASRSRKRSRNWATRAPDGAWYQLTCSGRSVSRRADVQQEVGDLVGREKLPLQHVSQGLVDDTEGLGDDVGLLDLGHAGRSAPVTAAR